MFRLIFNNIKKNKVDFNIFISTMEKMTHRTLTDDDKERVRTLFKDIQAGKVDFAEFETKIKNTID